MNNESKWLEEYKEAGLAQRFHNTLLIGELTVYLVTSGAILSLVFRNPPPSQETRIMLALAGTIITIVFYLICERSRDYLYSARNRSKALEKELRFSLYSDGPKSRKVFSAINAIRFLYAFSFLGWIIALINCMPCITSP